MSSLLIEKICSCYFGKRLNVCCGNDESDDCVETASNCVDLWPISAHREGSDRRVYRPHCWAYSQGKLSVRTLTTRSSLKFSKSQVRTSKI